MHLPQALSAVIGLAGGARAGAPPATRRRSVEAGRVARLLRRWREIERQIVLGTLPSQREIDALVRRMYAEAREDER